MPTAGPFPVGQPLLVEHGHAALRPDVGTAVHAHGCEHTRAPLGERRPNCIGKLSEIESHEVLSLYQFCLIRCARAASFGSPEYHHSRAETEQQHRRNDADRCGLPQVGVGSANHRHCEYSPSCNRHLLGKQPHLVYRLTSPGYDLESLFREVVRWNERWVGAEGAEGP